MGAPSGSRPFDENSEMTIFDVNLVTVVQEALNLDSSNGIPQLELDMPVPLEDQGVYDLDFSTKDCLSIFKD